MLYLRTSFKKMFSTPLFWASVLIIVCICMLSPLFTNPQTGVTESIFYVYTHYTKDAMCQDVKYSAYSVFSQGLGGWLQLFIPVLVLLSPVSIRLDEITSGTWRFVKSRTGKRVYSLSACFFYLLSGGLIVSLGYLLFGICVSYMFPDLSCYQPEQIAFLMESTFWDGSVMRAVYESGGIPFAVCVQFAQIFSYGTSCTLVGLILSSFVENKYIIVCTPFFLKYTLSRISASMIAFAYQDWENPNELLGRLANIINPESLVRVFFFNSDVKWILLFHMILVTGSVALFCVISVGREKYAA